MWNFFIKNDRFAYLIILALMCLGGYAVLMIPKESTPEVVIPVGVVTTILPGAPAADVESLVTNEIERELNNLENVKQITSVSQEGVSNITVEFDASADLDTSITDLKDEIDTIIPSLPDDAEDPRVTEVDFTEQPIMTVALFADLGDRAFTDLTNDLSDIIESLSGVSKVTVSGVRDHEINVIVNEESLVRYNLSLNKIISALASANRSLPIGQIEHNGVSYNIAFEGDLTSSADVANTAVTTRGGQPVYVRDIARVEDGLSAQTRLSRVSLNGNPSKNAVSFDVYKQSGGDITRITAAINEKLEELQASGELLAGVEVLTVLDMGEDIKKDLVRLSSSGLQTVVLVVLLLVVAIGWREGLLAGTAIPLSFLIGFIGLYLSGNTINFLSLFSLILGIGILVDSAIVMVEGINRRMKDNPTIDKREAALLTIEEFKTPLISGTLTTVSMFVGLFIVSGVIGQFIASIPFTLVFLLFASMFVSLAIIPLFAAGFLHRRNSTVFEERQVEYAHRLERWYQSKLTPFIENIQVGDRYLALLFALLVAAVFLAINTIGGVLAGVLLYVGISYIFDWSHRADWSHFRFLATRVLYSIVVIAVVGTLSFTVLPKHKLVDVIFFEQSDVDYVIVEIEQPEGTTKEVTDIAARRTEELLYSVPEIESYVLTVGSGSQYGSGGSGEKFANFFITLRPDREVTSTEVVELLREKLSPLNDLKVTVSQPSDGPPTGAAITIKFLGDDLVAITELANQAALLLQNEPGIVNVETSTNSNNTEYVLTLDRAKAAQYGLDIFTVSQIARSAVFGADATSLTTLSDDIEVTVKLNATGNPSVAAENTNHITIDDLTRITLPTSAGNIPLSSIVSVSLRESSARIAHEDGSRVVSITADVAEGVNARDAQATALAEINDQLSLSDDVRISTGGGETEESNEAFLEMFFALIVGVLLMVGILVLQFNSYLHMRYVLSILPYSLIGIFAGLALTQNPLSFPSMMGFIALSGIVVNNSILLIDMMNNLRRQDPTRPIKEVVLHAASNRLRPILLTTATTVIGMIPLTYAGDLWAPLAYAVMFGLLFSVVITLILIPIVYYRHPGTLH